MEQSGSRMALLKASVYLYVTHANRGKDGSTMLLENLGIQTAVFLFAATRFQLRTLRASIAKVRSRHFTQLYFPAIGLQCSTRILIADKRMLHQIYRSGHLSL
jgi:hypothetical protein